MMKNLPPVSEWISENDFESFWICFFLLQFPYKMVIKRKRGGMGPTRLWHKVEDGGWRTLVEKGLPFSDMIQDVTFEMFPTKYAGSFFFWERRMLHCGGLFELVFTFYFLKHSNGFFILYEAVVPNRTPKVKQHWNQSVLGRVTIYIDWIAMDLCVL